VVDFFEPWLKTVTLREAVTNLESPLQLLADTLKTAGIDDDIIARRLPAIEANIEQLRRCRDGQSKIEPLDPATFNDKKGPC